MVTALFWSVDADRALKQTQAAAKAARAKPARQAPCHHVELSVTAQRKTQEPDVVIEIEDSSAVRERGHMLIAIENPNPELEVKIDHRTKGQPILGSTVRFEAIWSLKKPCVLHMCPLLNDPWGDNLSVSINKSEDGGGLSLFPGYLLKGSKMLSSKNFHFLRYILNSC